MYAVRTESILVLIVVPDLGHCDVNGFTCPCEGHVITVHRDIVAFLFIDGQLVVRLKSGFIAVQVVVRVCPCAVLARTHQLHIRLFCTLLKRNRHEGRAHAIQVVVIIPGDGTHDRLFLCFAGVRDLIAVYSRRVSGNRILCNGINNLVSVFIQHRNSCKTIIPQAFFVPVYILACNFLTIRKEIHGHEFRTFSILIISVFPDDVGGYGCIRHLQAIDHNEFVRNLS